MGGMNPMGMIGAATGLGSLPSMAAGGAVGNQIGGGKGGGGPSAPDFAQAATPNQTNAFGVNSNWTKGPNGQYTQNQSFGGPLGDLNQNLQGQAANAWQSPLDNGAQARQHAEDALYSRATARLDPMWNQKEAGLQTSLANSGLDVNSEAGRNAQMIMGRQRNDAYSSALNDAISGGGQEASRQQGMDLQSRMAPMMGLGGMAGLTGQTQNPLLAASMAQYQGDLQKYGIEQSGKNSAMGGLANLGGAAAIAASDERVKTDVKRLATEVLPGVPVATFRYKADPHRHLYSGVIAQDVEAAGYGHLVKEVNGIKMVHGSLAPVRIDNG